MSFGTEIVTLLNTDAALLTLLPGGVHFFSEGGRKGLNRVAIQEFFDTQIGLQKPGIIVIETDEQADDQIVGKDTSFVNPIAVFIYNQGDPDKNGNDPYAVIEQAKALVYADLHLAQITGACQILYRKTIKDKHEPILKDAAFYQMVFNVHGYL